MPSIMPTPLLAALSVVIALGAPMALSACSPVGVVVGAGATVGIAASSERGVEGAARDLATKGRIVEKWASADHTLAVDFTATVYEGRVLLTGVAADEARRSEAVRLAWQVDGVREVLNEIEVGQGGGVEDFTNDTTIATRLKSALAFDKQVYAVNYEIEVKSGVVYLMGIAQSRDELERVVDHARAIRYVRRVVPLARVKTAEGASQ